MTVWLHVFRFDHCYFTVWWKQYTRKTVVCRALLTVMFLVVVISLYIPVDGYIGTWTLYKYKNQLIFTFIITILLHSGWDVMQHAQDGVCYGRWTCVDGSKVRRACMVGRARPCFVRQVADIVFRQLDPCCCCWFAIVKKRVYRNLSKYKTRQYFDFITTVYIEMNANMKLSFFVSQSDRRRIWQFDCALCT